MTQIPLEAENEFYAAMEREDAEQLEREARAAASARLNALALQLKREFSTAELGRQGLSPEQVQQQLMLALAQSQQQAAQAQSEQPMEGTAA